jgi:lipoprotein-releasing system permease protein
MGQEIMSFEFKIALRYIFSKRSYNFITVITTISIVGISVGVAALIAVLSIFNGFQKITENQITGFDPHIRISKKEGSFSNSDSLIKNINIASVVSDAYVLSGKAIAMNNDKVQVFNVMSIDETDADYLTSIKNNIYTGMFDISNDAFDKAIIGARLADRMRVLPGDTLTLYSPQMLERSLVSYRIPQPVHIIVWGIFQINIKDYDHNYAFINIDAARRLFRTSYYNYYDIRIQNIHRAEKIKSGLKKEIGNDYNISSWIDLNKDLYGIMQFERMASFIIMSLIIVIAVFNILASLTMTVVEKQKDIAILKSYGATEQSIRKIFIYEGLIIGLISTFSGVILGLGFCYGQIYFKWFTVDNNKYIIDSIPVVINYSDVIVIAALSLILSFFSTIYPSKTAGNTNIATSLKSE